MKEKEIEKIREIVKKAYENAKNNIPQKFAFSAIQESYNQKISDNIPGYEADLLKFGSFDKDKFAVLFIDMRGSTKRAKRIGPENTFLTMHAFIAGMLEVVKNRKGIVIDIMGDGLMVFFGGRGSGVAHSMAVKNAGLCGNEMLEVIKEIINPILDKDKIGKIECGVGVDFGDVIVTKIGINEIYDVKAIGDCINMASKYADKANNEVIVSKSVKKQWPSSKGGTIYFKSFNQEGYILKRK